MKQPEVDPGPIGTEVQISGGWPLPRSDGEGWGDSVMGGIPENSLIEKLEILFTGLLFIGLAACFVVPVVLLAFFFPLALVGVAVLFIASYLLGRTILNR